MQEKQLIVAARKGDDAAFEKLIERYRAKIYGICLRLLCAEDDAADAAQETMIKIYLSLGHYHFRASFATWVYALAKNTALDHRRRRSFHREVSMDALPDGGESLIILEDRTGEALEARERRQELIRLIHMLPEEQRICLILKDMDGYSCEEIAEITGFTLGTVKSRLHRGRDRLQKLIRESVLL